VAAGGTVFLTSHVLEIVERLCDHVGVIHRGRLVTQGPMARLREGADVPRRLEDVFLELVGADREHVRTLEWLSG
jgi:ABC-2 type transport system ATP-binding protein